MNPIFKRFLLTAFGCLFPVVASSQVLWSDEFDSGSAPDLSTWSHDLGAHGWGNHELQEYTALPDNARVENGHLVITAHRIPGADGGTRFTSARIHTQDKLTFRYGTVEARIRVPDLGDGLWPAFWTLGNDFGEVGWPRCGEIDIMEMGSADAIAKGLVNRRVGSTAHWDDRGVKVDSGQWRDAERDLHDGFHVFRMDWTPTRIAAWVDDALVWTFDIDAARCTDCSEFHRPHFLLLNLAVGGSYTGRLAPDGITAPMPAEMWVDYVRILDNGYTELGGAARTSPASR